MNKTSAVFSIGFRPFFILAALMAILNPALWISHYLGHITLSLNTDALFWHAHEMIFGFTGALIAGFILTASANWTGSTPYRGRPLIILIALWILERVSCFLPLSNMFVFVMTNLFFPALTIMLLIKLWKFPKQRNVFIPLLVGITLGKILHSWGYFFSSELELSGRHLAIGLIRLLVLLLAGRVIPFFTRKKIERINISFPAWINPFSLFPILLLAIPWSESTPKLLLAILFTWAITANAIRFFLWKPYKTVKIPILFVLNTGVILILISLIQELMGLFDDSVHFTQAALHMLMAGGLGTVAIAIMTRVSLGHTGRVIKADRWIQLAYILVVLGAIIRSIIPIYFIDFYETSLYFAASFWILGFLIFLIKNFRLLVTPRPDGKI